jgi:hypothetical protein
MNSNMGRGKLQYTLPSLEELLSVDSTAGLDQTTCALSVLAVNDGGAQTTINCDSYTCKVTFYDIYTPALFRVLPQAVFFNTRTTLFVDTARSQSFKTTGTDMPFRIAFVDTSNLNYEIWLDEDDELSAYSMVEINGQSGDAPVNSTSVPRINFHCGDAALVTDSLTTCPYDYDSFDEDCYIIKSLAVVDSLEYSTGYTTGGQYLTFWGMRLIGEEETTVTLDGVACTIQDDVTTKEEGTCLTGEAAQASATGQYVGSYGLRRDIYYSNVGEDDITIGDIEGTGTYTESELLTSFEFPDEALDEDTYASQASITSGWFMAPASENYIFHVTCDDSCVLYLS